MDNSLDFIADGPFMDGNWYNPTTGDSFTVRDTYFEGEQFYVIAVDGRRFDARMIENYIKSDEKISKKPAISPNQPVKNMDCVDNVLNSIINTTVESPILQESINIQEDNVKNEDQKLVNRILNRTTKPEVKASINWKNFPDKQIDCLLNMLCIDVNDIIAYYISNIDIESIKKTISEEIKKKFLNNDIVDIKEETIISKEKKKKK